MDTQTKITIALDCMGGDFAPNSILDSLKIIEKEFGDEIKFLLYGDEEQIIPYLQNIKVNKAIYEIIPTEIIISSDEKPSVAIRKGKDSSMGLAIQAVKNKEAHACVSAGNTGALMALSKLILRPLPDIDRPALIQMMPNKKNTCTAMLDMGANVECDSLNLYQFALMGNAFYSAITGKENPNLAILNIGSEDIKGKDNIKTTATMLQESIVNNNFQGFIEGNHILDGDIDVIITDGFTGNVTLKTMEGTAKFFTEELKKIFLGSFFGKIAYLLICKPLNLFKKKINPTNYNGAMFIGLNGISIKSHGNANGESFANAIKNTINLIKNDVNNKIINLIKETEE